MATSPPIPAPSVEGLARDLAKVLTVGVGHPVRKEDEPIEDLELVAARLSDPSFPPLRQVEEVVREAIGQFGTTSDFAIATALVFGTHEDTTGLTLSARREKAADMLKVSEYTLTHTREERMQEALAGHLLTRYAETSSTTAVAEMATADDEAEQTSATLPTPQRWRRYAGFIAAAVVLLTIAVSVLLGMNAPGDRRAPKTTGTASALAGLANALQPSYTSATAQLQLVVEVKLRGELQWRKRISVLPGADVFWMIGTKDVSKVLLDNVVLRDVLPPHLKVVPGSVRLINTSADRVQTNKPLFAQGFNVGNYAPGGALYAVFDTIAQGDFSGCRVTVSNIGKARSDQTSTEATDWANTQIIKPNCDK